MITKAMAMKSRALPVEGKISEVAAPVIGDGEIEGSGGKTDSLIDLRVIFRVVLVTLFAVSAISKNVSFVRLIFSVEFSLRKRYLGVEAISKYPSLFSLLILSRVSVCVSF